MYTQTNERDFLFSVYTESERHVPALRQWAEKGVYRNPLDNSLMINYPPITVAPPINPADYATFEQALSSCPDCGISLYVHIPVCTRKCTYCNYYSLVGQKVSDNYIDLLEKELAIYKSILGAKPVTIRSIYLGGGTPSLLSTKQVERILGFINKSFQVQDGAEISMEFHPELVNQEKAAQYLQTISALGVNRVSTGIQSLDDGVLRAINRGHTKTEAMAFMDLITQQNFQKVNFDIIYGGLPFQSLKSVYETLKHLLTFKPTSITKHFCEIKKESVDFCRYKSSTPLYPSWTENIHTQTLIDMFLTENGYQKELLHMYTSVHSLFSHQKQKWSQRETILMCLGPGTYGWIFHNNTPKNLVLYKSFSLKDYENMVLNNIIPIERLATLEKDETSRRHIQYALNYGYIDKTYLQALIDGAETGTGKEINLLINKLEDNQFLNQTQGCYKISALGEYLSDEIKALFASEDALDRRPGDDIHAAHHWYPNTDLIRRFKHIILHDGNYNSLTL
ncbi:MAG: radical SAM protein [Candidatus Schekmanbacteria bacterium]|nr:radical SAM protein [Candidatus Schekmanbacteria bacterium]